MGGFPVVGRGAARRPHTGSRPTSPLNDPPRPDKHGGTPEWLLRVTIESVLIVTSILFALAVDGMRENRRNHRVALQSLEIFQREMCANRARVEDGLPYHIGVRDVVAGMSSDPARAEEVRSMVEGLEPALLLNTAWETALATGALTHMELRTVSALSLTYSMQDRFTTESSQALPRLLVLPSASPQERLSQVQQTLAYLNNLVRTEQRLQAVYNEAIGFTDIAARLMSKGSSRRPAADSAGAAADTAGAEGASSACKPAGEALSGLSADNSHRLAAFHQFGAP